MLYSVRPIHGSYPFKHEARQTIPNDPDLMLLSNAAHTYSATRNRPRLSLLYTDQTHTPSRPLSSSPSQSLADEGTHLFCCTQRDPSISNPCIARMCIPMLPDDHFGFWIVGSSVPSKTYSQQPLPATVATVDPAIFSLSGDFEISSTPVGLPFHLD